MSLFEDSNHFRIRLEFWNRSKSIVELRDGGGYDSGMLRSLPAMRAVSAIGSCRPYPCTTLRILYAVDTIESALAAHQKVSFLYFDLDEHCRRIYRKEKVLMDDRYYLLARSQDREGNSIYRIDKMEQVQTEAEAVSSEALREQTSVANYTGQTVRMFAGKPSEVVLRFSEKAIGAVYDEFGEDTAIERLDDTTCQGQ